MRSPAIAVWCPKPFPPQRSLPWCSTPRRARLPATRSAKLTFHLPRLVRLDHIALLDVLEVREHDAALEAGVDLAHVLVEASQARDRRVVDHGRVAHEPDARAADDMALGDEAARDRADPGGAEGLADLRLTHRLLDLFGLEHALHRRAQLLDGAVDHGVAADLDPLALGNGARVADRAHVEGEDHRVGGRREHHVGLVDPADAAVDDVDGDLVLRELRDLVLDGLDRARDVALEHEVEL